MLDYLNIGLIGNSNIDSDTLQNIKRAYYNARLQKQQADEDFVSGVEANKEAFAKLKRIQNKGKK